MDDGEVSSFINARWLATSGSAANLAPPREGASGKGKRRTAATRAIATGKSASLSAGTAPRVRTSRSRRAGATAGATAPTSERVICCVCESARDVSTNIGVCVINYNTGELILSEFMDSQIYIRTIHKLQVHQPTDILLSFGSLSPTVSKLATIIKFNIPENVRISEAPAKFFVAREGLNAVVHYSLSGTETAVLREQLADKVYALNSAAAAVKYIEDAGNSAHGVTFAKFRVKYEATENTMVIDSKTIRGLELIQNSLDPKDVSLLKFLDSTCTRMGRRSLRNCILQPLTDKESISMRLETVGELKMNEPLLSSLRADMKTYQDLDRLLSKMLSANHSAIKPEHKVNYVISLKDTLFTTKRLQRVLDGTPFSSRLLSEIHEVMNSPTLATIEGLLNSYINEDCSWASSSLELQNQRSYAVRSGANGLLDISRQIYKSTMEGILQQIQQLSEEYELPLDYGFDSSRGFYLKVRKERVGSAKELPPAFVNAVAKKRHIECTTLPLVKENHRLKEIISEISFISEAVVQELLDKTTEHMSALFMVSEAVALLDLLCCFAHNAGRYSYNAPRFSDKLFLQQARHPFLEAAVKDFVANDISSTRDSSRLQIVTGCNKSGKSVYLKQVATLCVMAQMGSYVPAESALFPIYTKLHARLCTDSIELTSSNFSFEMKEMAFFLHDVDESTLLIVDELGRGSSIGDGFSISLAITEHLLDSGCTVFLSTHFQDIPRILRNKPSVLHLHMQTEELSDSSLKMHYSATTNALHVASSGIKSACALFRPDIVAEAYRISDLLRNDRLKTTMGSMTDGEREKNLALTNQIKKIHILVAILREYTHNETAVSAGILKRIQAEFLESFDT